MNLTAICDRLDDELRTDDFAEIDGSPNGLQLGPSQAEIDRVAFAVDVASATIAEAVDREADLLVAHHGLWWEGTKRITGNTYDRVAALIAHEIALYVSHLPLDAHPELGNAAGVGDAIELASRERFGECHGEYVGLRGRVPEPMALSSLVDRVHDELGGAEITALAFGPDEVEHVAIVTGNGVDWLGEAVEVGADVLVTGERKHGAYHEARESDVNVLLAGHYATETFGVRALAALVGSWGVETTFIDHPTGL